MIQYWFRIRSEIDRFQEKSAPSFGSRFLQDRILMKEKSGFGFKTHIETFGAN